MQAPEISLGPPVWRTHAPLFARPARVAMLLMSLLCGVSAEDAARRASKAEEFQAALAVAAPGDEIILADGTRTDVHLLLETAGTVSAPLRIRAQTPGKVILTGASRLTFAAPHVHMDGLFSRDGALPTGLAVVYFRSDHCRLTESAIVDYPRNSAGRAHYYIYYEGSHNTVERCYLSGKANPQPAVGNHRAPARHNAFNHSFIRDIPAGRENGREIFRLWGYGNNEEVGDDGAFFTIEGNLFDHADGESAEIISLKSNRNRVINTTICATLGRPLTPEDVGPSWILERRKAGEAL